MNKYLSVLGLYVRWNLWKILAIILVTALAAGFLVYRVPVGDVLVDMGPDPETGETIQAITYYGRLDHVIAESRAPIVCAVGFAAIAAVMSLTGCGYGAKSGYTVRRLRVKESRATLLWGIYHAALLVAFWAALAAAMYIALRLRMGMETPASADSCGPQSMLLLCYTDTFMHHLVPLRDAAMWALGAASVLAVGFGSVLFAYRQRRGQFSILILAAVAATILSFFYGIGSNMLFVLMALQLVLADGAVVSVIRGGNSHEV